VKIEDGDCDYLTVENTTDLWKSGLAFGNFDAFLDCEGGMNQWQCFSCANAERPLFLASGSAIGDQM
jgi:hypothetical protein